MKVVLDEGAKLPTRGHIGDAGIDLYSRESCVIEARGSHCFDTGVHVEIPYGAAGFLKSKSGLNVKHNITSEGVIDYGYTGSIVAKLYNNSDVPVTIEKGQKITQLVILPVVLADVELADKLDDTERGDNGFGSTGRF